MKKGPVSLIKNAGGIYTASSIGYKLAKSTRSGVGNTLVKAAVIGAGIYGGLTVASWAFSLAWWILSFTFPLAIIGGVGYVALRIWNSLKS